MKPGIYPAITNAEYHHGAGISKSGLDLVHRSPLHYRAVLEAANDNAPTSAQLIGTAFHTLMLEPHLFTLEYTLGLRQSDVPEAIADRDRLVAMVEELNASRLAKLPTSGSKAELVARLKSEVSADGWATPLEELSAAELKAIVSGHNEQRPGKLPTTGTMQELARTLRDAGRPVTLWADVKDEWLTNNGHRTVLQPDVWEQLHNMRAAVMAHPAASALLNAPGKAEQSVYWIDPASGELCRCRPDFWRDDSIMVDLKTTEDASTEAFGRSILNYRYHVQEAIYRDGAAAVGRPVRAFLFLAVEKSACVVDGKAKGVAVYTLDADSVTLGRNEYRADLAAYAECRRSGKWTGYGDRIQPIALPVWFLNRNADQLGAA